MKILYLTPHIYNSAGTERVLSMKVNYLVQQAGYDIVIVTTDQKEKKNFFDFDTRIKHYDLGLNYEDDFNKNILSKTIAHYRKNAVYKKRLADIIEKEKPDVCVSMFGKEIEFICNMNLACKIVAELHFNQRLRYDVLTANHHGWLWEQIGEFRTRQMIRETKGLDRLVVLTKEDMEQWQKTNNNVCQIYNPLPYESSEIAPLNEKTIISVGRLSPQKNYSSLIKAWVLVHQKHPDWQLNIWGDGELKDQLQAEIREQGIEQSLHLCGRTNDVSKEYLRSSAYVMSSAFEGFPMVLLEAASFGLPLISYTCYCGPKDIIDNEVNGFLVNQNDEQGLADAICKIIEDEPLRQEMGKQAKITSQQFSQENILPLWPKFFESLK